MDADRIKEDFGNTWKRLAEGWRHLSGKAAHALTYFNPTRTDEPVEDARWGILAADVTEQAEAFLVELEAPGLAKDEIDVSVEDQRLIVTGTKRYENERKEGSDAHYRACVRQLSAGDSAAGKGDRRWCRSELQTWAC